eukprot:5807403-Pyramimonas_sp.AAC.1
MLPSSRGAHRRLGPQCLYVGALHGWWGSSLAHKGVEVGQTCQIEPADVAHRSVNRRTDGSKELRRKQREGSFEQLRASE